MRRRSLAAVVIAAAMILAMGGWLAVSRSRHCGLPATGDLTPAQVDGRSAVACDLVGRTVRGSDGGAGVAIPRPGEGVGVNADGPAGASSLSLSVGFDGRISVK